MWQGGIRRGPRGKEFASSIDQSPQPPTLVQLAVPSTSGAVDAEPPSGQTIGGILSTPGECNMLLWLSSAGRPRLTSL